MTGTSRWRPRAIVLAAVMLSLAGPAAADFSDGLRAYDGGRYGEAREEWLAAAAKGDVDAYVGLAGLYAAGFGVNQDLAEAARWYEKAARRGHAIAQLNLGDYHARGWGVKRDLVTAYMWLTLAARQGKRWAAERARALEARMTPTQIAAARSRANIFKVENR